MCHRISMLQQVARNVSNIERHCGDTGTALLACEQSYFHEWYCHLLQL